jgi:hypothetical protein
MLLRTSINILIEGFTLTTLPNFLVQCCIFFYYCITISLIIRVRVLLIRTSAICFSSRLYASCVLVFRSVLLYIYIFAVLWQTYINFLALCIGVEFVPIALLKFWYCNQLILRTPKEKFQTILASINLDR